MPVLEATNTSLIQELRSARLESDRLFSILKHEALYERPIAERHRVIFYIGHLDGFDSIQICREALGINSPDTELDALFLKEENIKILIYCHCHHHQLRPRKHLTIDPFF